MVKNLYNKELFSNITYDETSSTYLRCNKTGRECGSLETSKNSPKSARLWINKKRYLIHRVIWVLKYGGIDPNLDIDHIDGNPWNNNIKNIRLVEKRLNQRNRKKMSNNKTGVNGVFFTQLQTIRVVITHILEWFGLANASKCGATLI